MSLPSCRSDGGEVWSTWEKGTFRNVPELPHAQAFLARLSEVMPLGYRAVVDGDLLLLISPDGGRAGSSSYWLTSEALPEDEVLTCAVQSLHQIQQEIAEETTEPWPAPSGSDYKGFPEPDGELVGDQLRLWFGAADAPALALRPIDVSGVIVPE
jgi:hypothetical protein